MRKRPSRSDWFCPPYNMPAIVGNYYTVRGFYTYCTDFASKPFFYLEELRNGIMESNCDSCDGRELPYPIDAFREVEFPPNMELEIKEALEAPTPEPVPVLI